MVYLDQDEPLSRDEVRAAPTANACRRLLKQAACACMADEATLWIFGHEDRELEGTFAHSGTDDNRRKLEKLSVPVSESIVGMVASMGEPVCVGPDAEFNKTVDEAVGATTNAMLAAPVYLGDEVCGVLSAVRLDGNDRTFDEAALREVSWWAYLMGLILGSGRD